MTQLISPDDPQYFEYHLKDCMIDTTIGLCLKLEKVLWLIIGKLHN